MFWRLTSFENVAARSNREQIRVEAFPDPKWLPPIKDNPGPAERRELKEKGQRPIVHGAPKMGSQHKTVAAHGARVQSMMKKR
jgi:hypothetical protein